MGTLKNKVEQVIQARFPGAQMLLEEVPLSARLSGHVIWDGFDTMNARERQQVLRQVLHTSLTPQEELNLSVILALTTTELDGILEAA
ncbi:hypothetical protein [Armatimonas sp.]|uniref:hypothetical protein n=1 Tax=Armatimonas sp. TaxID=1872638 RepID=UPI0037520CAB